MFPLCVIKNELIFLRVIDVETDGTVRKYEVMEPMNFYYTINIKCGENWENKFTENKVNYLKGFLENDFAPNKVASIDDSYTFGGEEYIELKGKAKDDWERLTELDHEEFRRMYDITHEEL